MIAAQVEGLTLEDRAKDYAPGSSFDHFAVLDGKKPVGTVSRRAGGGWVADVPARRRVPVDGFRSPQWRDCRALGRGDTPHAALREAESERARLRQEATP